MERDFAANREELAKIRQRTQRPRVGRVKRQEVIAALGNLRELLRGDVAVAAEDDGRGTRPLYQALIVITFLPPSSRLDAGSFVESCSLPASSLRPDTVKDTTFSKDVFWPAATV